MLVCNRQTVFVHEAVIVPESPIWEFGTTDSQMSAGSRVTHSVHICLSLLPLSPPPAIRDSPIIFQLEMRI